MLGGADVAMLVGLPVAALGYVLTYRSFDLNKERRMRPRPMSAWSSSATRMSEGAGNMMKLFIALVELWGASALTPR
jgi:hypothetical protein